MDWKEFFRPTKWKIILSFLPLILLILSYLLLYSISKFLSEGNLFYDVVPFGIYLFTLIFFWPPLSSIFCGYDFLADNCYGFLAFPEITLFGYLLTGLINGLVIYLIYSLIAKIAIKQKQFLNTISLKLKIILLEHKYLFLILLLLIFCLAFDNAVPYIIIAIILTLIIYFIIYKNKKNSFH